MARSAVSQHPGQMLCREEVLIWLALINETHVQLVCRTLKVSFFMSGIARAVSVFLYGEEQKSEQALGIDDRLQARMVSAGISWDLYYHRRLQPLQYKNLRQDTYSLFFQKRKNEYGKI